MKKTVVLFLFAIHASTIFAQTPDSPVCIPFENDGKQIAILIQGEISPDNLTALRRFIRDMAETNHGKETVRIAILRDGVCIPSDSE